MSTENLSLWGRGLLPPVPTANQIKAALLMLSIPLKAEAPPTELEWSPGSASGPMGPREPNPEFQKWAKELLERIEALCLYHRIKPTDSGGIDWASLAYRLIFDYEPKDKSAPRIRLKRTAGAKLKSTTPQARADRRDLLRLVEAERANNASLSVNGFAGDLADKPRWQKRLPVRFQGKSAETLRKQIALAQDEAASEAKFRAMLEHTGTFADLLNHNPALSTGTGEGLKFRPGKTPGKKSDSSS